MTCNLDYINHTSRLELSRDQREKARESKRRAVERRQPTHTQKVYLGAVLVRGLQIQRRAIRGSLWESPSFS